MTDESYNLLGLRGIVISELQQQGGLQQVEWYDSIDSTNSEARRLLSSDNLQRPALLIADEQLSGRGRSDRRWWSPRGCLMFTLVVDGHQFARPTEEHCPLALLCGVALADAVGEILGAQTCQLKWPNDLYLHGKKLAGILIESLRGGSKNDRGTWLIGIGLNVDIDWRQAPEEVRERAICMSSVAGQRVQCDEALIEVVRRLMLWLDEWKRGERHWLDGWAERCLLTGKWVQVQQRHPAVHGTEHPCIEGMCEGVDELGRLLVRSLEGCRALSIGEVVRWGT